VSVALPKILTGTGGWTRSGRRGTPSPATASPKVRWGPSVRSSTCNLPVPGRILALAPMMLIAACQVNVDNSTESKSESSSTPSSNAEARNVEPRKPTKAAPKVEAGQAGQLSSEPARTAESKSESSSTPSSNAEVRNVEPRKPTKAAPKVEAVQAGQLSSEPARTAPPCKDGAATCKPWERDWSNSWPKVGDVVTPDGKVIRGGD
jgi:hypothetical protein